MARDATRRRVLTAAAAVLPLVAAGCKGIAALGTPPKAAPDVTVATDAVAVETQLIARYQAVLAANPTLAPALRPLLGQHHEHLTRLHARLIVPAGGQPLPTPRATAHRTAQVPGTPAAALGYLRDAEDAASGALLAHLATAPPSLAQLLASISASEATHALILGTAARHS
ncbi:MAG TPA: hypothetical protein VGI05_06955 [Streptosporangiaceae bacterium]|jgi:hypothetical protein